jgi:hypothetical protein
MCSFPELAFDVVLPAIIIPQEAISSQLSALSPWPSVPSHERSH